MNSRSITASADAKQFNVCSAKDMNAGLFHIRLTWSLLSDYARDGGLLVNRLAQVISCAMVSFKLSKHRQRQRVCGQSSPHTMPAGREHSPASRIEFGTRY